MKITNIETFVLESPFEYGYNAGDNDSHGPKFSCVVKVSTNEGIVGVGDIDSHPHVMRSIIDAPTAVPGFIAGLKDSLIGEDPLETEVLWNKMYLAGFYHGRRAAVIQAISGIDIALWDIKGKALGQSVSTLLGGKHQSKMKAYASTLFRRTPDEMKAAVDKYRSQGFKAIKFGWGSYTANPKFGVELVAAARKEAGDDIDIMVDGYITQNDITFAAEIINRLAESNVFWVEEPLPSDNVVGFGKLSQLVKTRIATGEQLGGRYEYENLILHGNPDVVQFDLSRCGGISEAKRIIMMAQMQSKLVCPHAWASDFLTAASLHINANTENAIFQEFCTNDSPTSRDLVLEPIRLGSDGYINVPDGPGLGVSLNEDILKKYSI